MLKIGVIGAGAAGFFAAIHAASSGHKVIIFEKSTKILSKVKISGGGRCNVTNANFVISNLIQGYPRGQKFIRKVFNHFGVKDTILWFESRGGKLKTEADGRIFPVSDASQTIVDILLNEIGKYNVTMHKSTPIEAIKVLKSGFLLRTQKEDFEVNKLIVCTGGSPKSSSYDFLKELGHTIVDPIPSLFTFNAPEAPLTRYKGISLPECLVRFEGSKLSQTGPLLITHWGISGPAVLKLSAFGAKWLYENNYQAVALIRWQKDFSEDGLRLGLNKYKEAHPMKKVKTNALFHIPIRLWQHLVENAEIEEEMKWMEVNKKKFNKLIENLFKYPLKINGKTTFKEEFVTSGGIALNEINPETMESNLIPGLFLAGEVVDIDGITGGYNFQAAWSTGFLAGKHASNN